MTPAGTPPPVRLRFTRTYLLLLVVCLASLSLRLSLVDKKWVNPDEGAHLMDAALLLDGDIPVVDFSARQPLYVAVLAGSLKVLGTNLSAGRIVTVLFSILTGVFVFLLARSLFDAKVATLSAVIYWSLPFEIFASAGVKTEPFVNLLVCMSLWAMAVFGEAQHRRWLILSGVLAAMAFYMRQSALIVPPLVIIYLALSTQRRGLTLAKDIAGFAAGYVAVFTSVVAFYSLLLPPSVVLQGSLTPYALLQGLVRTLGGLFAGQPAPVPSGIDTAMSATEEWNGSLYYLIDAVSMHSFLLIAFGLSIIAWIRGTNRLAPSTWTSRVTKSHLVLYCWVVLLGLAYVYWLAQRGFFIDYFREFIPPLVIIFAAWLRYSVPTLEQERVVERWILVGLAVAIPWFLIQARFPGWIGTGHHASLAITAFLAAHYAPSFQQPRRRVLFLLTMAAIALFVFASRQPNLRPVFSGPLPSAITIGLLFGITWVWLEEHARPSFRQYGALAVQSVVVASLVLATSHAAIKLNRRYDSVWSPAAVKQVAEYLAAETTVDAEVISGAVIWEFAGLRRPFRKISHPLAFETTISRHVLEEIEQALDSDPPEVIILDGYTEKTYLRNVGALSQVLETRYDYAASAGPAAYEVRIYRLRRPSDGG